MKNTIFISILLISSLFLQVNFAFAGGGGGPGIIQHRLNNSQLTASVPNSGEVADFLVSAIRSFLDAGATLVSGLARSGSTNTPTAGAITSTIEGGAQVAAELAIADYNISQQQKVLVLEYSEMVKDGFLTEGEALNYIMIANYSGGAGRDAVLEAIRRHVGAEN